MPRLPFICLLLSLFAQAQSPFDGTWKLKADHAAFSEAPETFELINGTYTCTTCEPKIKVKASGTDQPVSGSKDFDTLSITPTDANNLQLTRKKDGKLVSESKDVVSQDGKTLISEFMEYPPHGMPYGGKYIRTRLAAGPPGSHAISGTWKATKLEDVTDAALTFTFKSTAEAISMKSGTGEWYEAKFDGKDYPFKGGAPGRTIALKRVSENMIEESIREDGKPIVLSQVTVTGNTLQFISKDLRSGTTTSFTANKQR